MKGKTVATLAAALSLTVLATGCGGGSDSEEAAPATTIEGSAATSSPEGKETCTLATKEEVQTAVGKPITATEYDGLVTGVTPGGYNAGPFCSYKGADGNEVVRLGIYDDLIQYNARKSGLGDDAKTVSGYGDDAYCFTQQQTVGFVTDLNVRKGEAWLNIHVLTSDESCAGPVTQLADLVVPRFS